MNPIVRFSWLLSYRASEALFDCANSSPLFTHQEPESYANRISADRPHIYHPIEFEPTNLFHQRLRAAISSEGYQPLAGKKFPYCADIPLFGPTRFGIRVQLFLPTTILVKVLCYDDVPFNEKLAYKQRKFDDHQLLKFVATFTVKQFVDGFKRGLTYVSARARPLIYLTMPTGGKAVFEEYRTLLAALLINVEGGADSDSAIFDHVYTANDRHNAKFMHLRQVLYNRQGFLAARTQAGEDNVKRQIDVEIARKERLYELGTALQAFYADYPRLRRDHQKEMDYLFFATSAYIKQPSLVFENSVTGTYAWECLLELFQLPSAFEGAERFDVGVKSPISLLFDQLEDREYTKPKFWSSIRDSLGDDYMAKAPPNFQLNIKNNYGAVAAGPRAKAKAIVITNKKRTAAEAILRKLVADHPELAKPAGELRTEIAKANPDKGRMRKALENLREIGTGAAGSVAATAITELARVLF